MIWDGMSHILYLYATRKMSAKNKCFPQKPENLAKISSIWRTKIHKNALILTFSAIFYPFWDISSPKCPRWTWNNGLFWVHASHQLLNFYLFILGRNYSTIFRIFHRSKDLRHLCCLGGATFLVMLHLLSCRCCL